ncbi:hybrid sensor histidine kinase/response regulator [Marixanthomonas ophiurae]|uniref:histidine kinase n=1 Tax=Marixanthomonas ophiurae TaxID=387659 RepID=A0A3E1QB67_9FLAO|nr:ATP-binding protein [Marixanthomonas ophiurae]RFN59368.1 response regulator [Marixanthomonas ophiurae]
MPKTKNRFTFKIILSYLVLGALAVVVGYFIYSEFKNYVINPTEKTEEKKFFATGSLVNLVYEADSFSRLALLTQKEEDYKKYITLSDSLFEKVETIKLLTNDESQKRQLDSVRELLTEKKKNIEQLRILKITNSKDTSLDDILNEFKKLDNSMGKLTLETFVENPAALTPKERSFWNSYIDIINQNNEVDTTQVQARMVDSMLAQSRYLVAEAKRENSRAQRSLQQKENELIRSDLTLSSQLRLLITNFEAENTKLNNLEKTKREASVARTVTILQGAAVVGFVVILLFTYFILSDFFRAERFKQSLEKSKKYAEDLLKSREQLIATVSHDLKTPLNTIVGYTGLMENTPLSEKQHHYVNQIHSGSEYVSKLVNDLLDFSKLEAGKLKMESVPFSLENLLQQTTETYRDMYSEKKVELLVTIAPELQEKVFESDPLRMQQILNNLVGNAFKFTETGSIELKATLQKARKKSVRVKIDVIDTGIGISEEKQQLIFKEFTQAEADTGKKFGGYGLGLAISKKLASLLDGSLKVKSEPNKGSTFTLKIPLKKSDRAVRKLTKKPETVFKGLKAVVFDDDPAMRTMLSELFGQMNIEVHDFEKFSAFEKAKEIYFDFVLTDIQMPTTSGFEILKHLKNGAIKNYSNQPIIAMTGSREHSRQNYLDKGFSEVLQKPFTKKNLALVLEKVLPSFVSNSSKKIKTYPSEDALKDKSIQTVRHEKSELYDLSLLRSFLDTDEALDDVLQVFYTQTKKDIAELERFVEREKLENVGQTVHRMLTMCRQISAKKVIPLLETLEVISEEGNKELPFLFEDLKVEINKLLTALQQDH